VVLPGRALGHRCYQWWAERSHGASGYPAAADLKVRSDALDRAYVDQGITFSLSGEARPSRSTSAPG
jgi:hypothetical protein